MKSAKLRAALVAALALVIVLGAGVFLVPPTARARGLLIQPASATMNVTSLSGVLTTGGSSYGIGSGIACPVTATLYQSGQIIESPLTVVACTSTSFEITIPSLSAGLYDLFLSGAGGSWVFNPGQLAVTSSSNPSTIVGSILRADWPAKSNYCGGTSACTTTGQTIGKIRVTASPSTRARPAR